MIRLLQRFTIVCVMFAVPSMPSLAESVSVTVIGTLTPAACVPTLTGGGVVDYGTLSASLLNPNTYIALPVKQLGFSIACTAPVRLTVQAATGRPNTVLAPTESTRGVGLNPIPLLGVASGLPVVGLGLDTDGVTKIGGYVVGPVVGSFTADGVAVDILTQRGASPSPNWALQSTAGSLYTSFDAQNRFTSWAAVGELTPVAFTNLSGILQVQAYLNTSSALNLSHPIILNGLTTIEILYL